MKPRLKFHQPILDLLQVDPVLPTDRVAAIEERERVIGTQFPASIREWFAVQGAEKLFHDNTNQDHLTKLAELGDPAESRQGYLRVATENQAVVAWYVRLADGDDPPVYDNNDEWYEDLSKTNWRRRSTTFTNFIFDMISSHCFHGWYTGMHISAKDSMPNEATLRRLREWFQQGPSTEAPDLRSYRFFTREGVIMIGSRTAEETALGRAEWSIEARTGEALLGFVRKLWNLGTLSQTLHATSCTKETRALGERVLLQVRTAP